MNKECNITSAEWQIMKVLWANGEVTSKFVSDTLCEKMKWKQATIKTLLNRLLEKAPRYTSNINVLMKSLEQFGDKISTEELQFLWTTIDKYKNGYIPFTVPLYLVKSYVVRFELYNL